MPLATWGGGGDPSGYFASLVAGMEDQVRSDAAALDRRHEAAQAAHDAETYDRYQAGLLTDEQWLAYIRRRRAETGYDPAQHENWVRADLEWSENIADSRAQSAFTKTGDYSDLLDYLQGKLGRTRDSAGRLELQQQIRQLSDQRDQVSFGRGAQAIANKIENGDATLDDYLKFLRAQRAGLRRGSPMADTVNKQIADTRAQITARDFERDLAAIDTRMMTQGLSPAEAGRQKRALVEASDLKVTDQTRYFSLLTESYKLEHSPDPAKLAELKFQLQTQAITPGQYRRALGAISDRIMPYDPESAFRLLGEADATADQYQAEIDRDRVPYRQYLDTYNAKYTGTKFISQMDGSEYQSLNCVMASAAMAAYAMGYKGLSGGDLRYLTGDTVGGTNLDQALAALGKAGVNTSGMSLMRGGEFEKFKQMVLNGRPSMLMGSNANLPDEAKARPGQSFMHNLLVTEYDPRKDAFHVYNSATWRSDPRSKDGYWIKANLLQDFGWGPGTTGSWLATPKGTGGGRGKAWHVIDVDTKPQRKGTPSNYHGIDNQGARGNERGMARSSGTARDPIPDSQEAVEDRFKERQREFRALEEMTRAYERGETTYGGTELTPEVMRGVDQAVLDAYDGEILLQDSLGNFGNADSLAADQDTFIAGAHRRNGDMAEQLLNSLVRSSMIRIRNSIQMPDPAARGRVMASVAAGFTAFGAAQGRADPNDPLSGIDPEAAGRIAAFVDLMTLAADGSVDLDSKRQQIADALDGLKEDAPGEFTGDGRADGTEFGNAVANVAGVTEDDRLVKLDLGTPVVVDGVVKVLPNRTTQVAGTDPETGEPTQVDVTAPDTSSLGDGHQWQDLPGAVFNTSEGLRVYRAVTTRKLLYNGYVPTADNDDYGWKKGTPLTSEQLAKVTPHMRATMVGNGGPLDLYPWTTDSYLMPDIRRPDGTLISGYVMLRDPNGAGWAAVKLPLQHVGHAVGGITDIIGFTAARVPDVTFQPMAHVGEFDLGIDPTIRPEVLAKFIRDGGAAGFESEPVFYDADGRIVHVDPVPEATASKYDPPSQMDIAREGLMQFLRGAAELQRERVATEAREAQQQAGDTAFRDEAGSRYMPEQQGLPAPQNPLLTDTANPLYTGDPPAQQQLPAWALPVQGQLQEQLDGMARAFGVRPQAPAPAAAPSPAPVNIHGKAQPKATVTPSPKLDHLPRVQDAGTVGKEVLEPAVPPNIHGKPAPKPAPKRPGGPVRETPKPAPVVTRYFVPPPATRPKVIMPKKPVQQPSRTGSQYT